MSSKLEYRFEDYLDHVGSAEEVMKKIDECKVCGAKLLQSHLLDYQNMFIQEMSRCLDCGKINNKVIHKIN